MDSYRQFGLDLAIEAGAMALACQRQSEFLGVDKKGKLDFVTRADIAIEAMTIQKIQTSYPLDSILGEEKGHQSGSSGRTWVIDPVDGTHNFIRGLTSWGISIALIDNGKPVTGIVFLPAANVLLSATRGEGAWLNGERLQRQTDLAADPDLAFTAASVKLPRHLDRWLTDHVRDELGLAERRCGCATAGLSEIIRSHADLYIGLGHHIWDIAAAALILEEVGLSHSLDWSADLHSEMHAFVCGKSDLVAKTRQAISVVWPVSDL